MYLGTAYESNSRYDMSTNIFTIAYQLSGEIRFLHRLVHALCKSRNREEAYQRYLELQENAKVPISPFRVYLDDIRHDNDLDAFSQLVVQYHLK